MKNRGKDKDGKHTTGLTRRQILKAGLIGGGAALFWHGDTLYGLIGGKRVALAAIPGGTLLPKNVQKFVTQLVIPPPMPPVSGSTYDITVTQFSQQILPTGLPATTVWSYASTNDINGTRNYPAFTIEADRNTPTRVTWRNGLVNSSNDYLPHLLPVDPTLHWANPPQTPDVDNIAGPDRRPDFTGKTYVPLANFTDPNTQYTQYTGPVPIVTHVHGMEKVPDWSDGYAEAWFLPAAGNIPAGYATVGTWYNFFRGKSGVAWASGTARFTYPNSQRPSTVWYHDHTLGMTRLNVYAGPAGFYIVRSADAADNPTKVGGGAAVLPGPAPQLNDPAGTKYYEIPIAIQDRSFNTNGSLFYPDNRAFFDGFLGPYIPDSDVSPIWNPEFFGNMMVVNGKTWPNLNVERRRYRFRLLNGCQSRFLILSFKSLDGTTTLRPDVWQIGNEGGYLRAPVRLKEILMAPAERADIIVDFSQIPLNATITMVNRGPDAPYGGGGFRPSDPQTTGLVMRFNVNVPLNGVDNTTPPAQLVMPTDIPTLTPTVTRGVALLEKMSTTAGVPPIPVEALLGIKDADPNATAGPGIMAPPGFVEQLWMDEITENPSPNAVETWEIYNFTADAHPIHIHEVFFQVINRQRLDRTTGAPIQTPRPAEPTENGFKDTVIAYPGEVTRVKMKFGPAGQFVWHCHIVEHEDNEMMRPYRIGPVQPGQPG